MITLKKIDLFGLSIQPKFKGKSKINSNLGGIISLLLILLLTIGFSFMGKELFEKKNPISNLSSVKVDEASVNLKDIPLVGGMISAEGKILHYDDNFNRSVKINCVLVELYDMEKEGISFNRYSLPMAKCSKDLLGEEYFDYIKQNGNETDSFLCPDFINAVDLEGNSPPEEGLYIKNPFGTRNSNRLVIYMEICDEKADPGCRDYLEQLGPFYFMLGHPQEFVNISSINDPFTRITNYSETTIFAGSNFRQVINFNINELITDEGLIFESNNTKLFYSADPPVYNTLPFSEKDRYLGIYIFSVNLIKQVNFRRYMKLQELVANLGGFIKICMLFVKLCFSNYSKWIFFNEIMAIKPQSAAKVNNIVNQTNNPSESSKIPVALKVKESRKSVNFSQFLTASLFSSKKVKHEACFEKATDFMDLLHLKNIKEQLEDKNLVKPLKIN